jgi:hypothetical protein
MRAIARSALSLALVLLAPAAHAGPGVNMRWSQCFGDGGTQNRDFACNTNVGSDQLVCSFELGSEVLQVIGQELTIRLVASSATLPAWWEFRNTGACRQFSLGMNTVVSPIAVNCTDWSNGASAGGIGAYTVGGVFGPPSAVIKIAAAVPPEAVAHLLPGTEYFSCNIVINHTKTVGTGACAGCTVPVCIVLIALKVTTLVDANDVTLTGPAHAPDSFSATWQGPTNPDPFLSCPRPVPTLQSTWGAVKSLYR